MSRRTAAILALLVLLVGGAVAIAALIGAFPTRTAVPTGVAAPAPPVAQSASATPVAAVPTVASSAKSVAVPTVAATPPIANPTVTATAARKPQRRLGVWLGTLSGPLDPVVAKRLAGTGAAWTRAYLDWNSVRLSSDRSTYDFSGFDARIKTLRDLGIQTIIEVRGNPDWAATSTCGPIDKAGGLDAFEIFMRQAVAHFDDYGVHDWEMYNEADNRDKAFGESGGIGCWGSDPEAYVGMLQRAYAAVHETDPAGRVLLGGLAFDCFPKCDDTNKYNLQFLDEILARGAAPYFDVANVHAFSSQNQVPRPNAGLVSEFWGRGFDIVGKVETFREVMRARGVSKPVVVTELSWTNNANLEMQARYVPKVLARALAADVVVPIWFSLAEVNNSWDDPGQAAYGLAGVAGDGYAERPSLTSFATAAREFGEYTSVRRLAPAEVSASAGVEGYAFTMSDGSKRWVLWARVDGQPDGGAASVRITMPATTVSMCNKLGDAIAVQPRAAYTLTDDPIYLRLQ